MKKFILLIALFATIGIQRSFAQEKEVAIHWSISPSDYNEKVTLTVSYSKNHGYRVIQNGDKVPVESEVLIEYNLEDPFVTINEVTANGVALEAKGVGTAKYYTFILKEETAIEVQCSRVNGGRVYYDKENKNGVLKATYYESYFQKELTSGKELKNGTEVTFTVFPDKGSKLKWIKVNDKKQELIDGKTFKITIESEKDYRVEAQMTDPETPLKEYVVKYTEPSSNILDTDHNPAFYPYQLPLDIRLSSGDKVKEGRTAMFSMKIPTYTKTWLKDVKDANGNTLDKSISYIYGEYSCSIDVTSDLDLTFEFEVGKRPKYLLHVPTPEHATLEIYSGSGWGKSKIKDGAEVTFAEQVSLFITPEEGYIVKEVRVNDKILKDLSKDTSNNKEKYVANFPINEESTVKIVVEKFVPVATYSVNVEVPQEVTYVLYDLEDEEIVPNDTEFNESDSLRVSFTLPSDKKISALGVNNKYTPIELKNGKANLTLHIEKADYQVVLKVCDAQAENKVSFTPSYENGVISSVSTFNSGNGYMVYHSPGDIIPTGKEVNIGANADISSTVEKIKVNGFELELDKSNGDERFASARFIINAPALIEAEFSTPTETLEMKNLSVTGNIQSQGGVDRITYQFYDNSTGHPIGEKNQPTQYKEGRSPALALNPVEGCKIEKVSFLNYSYEGKELENRHYDIGYFLVELEARKDIVYTIVVSGTPTANEEITNENNVQIENGWLHIRNSSNKELKCVLYSIDGAILYRGSTQEDLHLPIASGCYILEINGRATKIIVK